MNTDRIRTEPSEEFRQGASPVDRFTPILSEVKRPDPAGWAKEQLAECDRNEFTPLGQVSYMMLRERMVDFGRQGPLLGVNSAKRLVVATPVYSLPPMRVWHDGRGKPVWNLERLSERARRKVTAEGKIVTIQGKLEAFAESGKYQNFYVLQPLTQIEFYTADNSRRRVLANLWPDAHGRHACLLYDAATGQLIVYGGGTYTFS